ncbi:MAG: RNA 2',3'-cyclic phosphodiesterase [Candidatus Omnitrophica bacterium]|nr:RNA 2',3'-cyclic phosphodiesterase [Candidatus Omnitrophota bacterium]
MRCFIAIKLPQDVRQEIRRIQQVLRKLDLDAKWVEFENLHLTLKFLGEAKENQLPKIKEVVSNLSFLVKPFNLSISEVGAFPSIKRPRILWIGVKPQESPVKIIEYLEEQFSKLGFPQEKRTSHPHITLARLRTSKNAFKLRGEIEKMKIDSKIWLVDSVSLLRSILTPQGPIYEDIFRMNLTA